MAVPEQTPYSEHTGNGITTSFPLGFYCESKDHLIVLVDEIEPPIATWSLTGGNVVFTTAPAAGKKITLQRNTPLSRTTNYQGTNNSFRPETINKDIDKVWLKLQELFLETFLLKGYVDKKDDEIKAYLLEEIRKQGVALDQLDEYYNYLMQRLAQIAVDKGWDASFVVDGDKNQKHINTINSSKYVSVLDFDILGDGLNESTKFNLAMNRARSRSVPLDLAGLTIDTSDTALSIDVPLKNGKLKGRYQFVTKVNLSDVEVEIVHPLGFYIKGTSSNIIKFPILKNVKVKYADGVVPNDAYSVYAEYTDGLQIIGGEYEVIQLIKSPNYRIINATIDGKMRNNNELIHATYTSDGGIIAFNRFINALDNIVDLYASGAQTLFVHNQVENCGNRLGTVMELKITYSDVPENSSSVANGFARNIIISKNIFKNLKATHAVNTSVINIYSIDSRAVPSMTSADYISDIIVSDNIFDGFDTSGISLDIRFNCIAAVRANNIKIHGNIAKNIPKSKLDEQSAVVFLGETNDCSVINNKGCIDQCSGLAIQGVNNGLTISLNKFNKDVVTGFKPKFGLFLNQFTGSNSTVLNDPIVTDNDFEGSLRSVHGSLSQINRGIIDGKFVNEVWVGSINDSDVAIDVKNEIGSLSSIYLGGASVSSGNTLRKVHVSGTGVGTAMLLSNMQDTTVDGFKTKNLALSLNITGANSSNLDIRAPKQKDVASMINFDASVTAANKSTINIFGLTAVHEVLAPIVVSSKSENLVYINGASGFTPGMTLATSYSVYANGVVFNSVVTAANTIEVHIINNTASSITVPVGFVKVRSV